MEHKDFIEKIIANVLEQGKFEFVRNPVTGALTINGIAISLEQQKELVEYLDGFLAKYGNGDLEFPPNNFLNSPFGDLDNFILNKAKQVSQPSLSEMVEKALLEKKKPTFLENSEHPTEIQLKQEIERLKKENQRLLEKLEGKGIYYPDDFEEVSLYSEYWLDEEEIQQMIDDVAYLEVPLYSFASEAKGDTLVIKIHDDEGQHLIVTQDYLIAKVDK